MSGFQIASQVRLVMKKIFMTKWSRLEVKKTSVRISNGKNKMAAILFFDHLKFGLGFQMVGASLDRFIIKSNKKIFYSCKNGLG
jgi:hypothetical protein